MEHRETPRMATSEDPTRDANEPAASRRFARFVPAPSVRRIAFSRVGLVVLAGAAVAVLLALASAQLLQSVTAWLHRQPSYQLDGRQVVFDPPVPPWIKGGPEGFLTRLRKGDGSDEVKSVLDVDLERVRKDLRHDRWDYWVKRVIRIRRQYPNRLTVQLEYRKPAAIVVVAKKEFVVDEKGVILPREDVDFEALGPLVRILGIERAPAEENTGRLWKKADDDHESSEADERVLVAAELASFLDAALRSSKDLPKPAPRPTIHVDKGNLWLILQLGTNRWPVLWGEASPSAVASRATAEARLAWVLDYAKQHEPSELGDQGYLRFSKTGVAPNR
jgi:hypothetical protein